MTPERWQRVQELFAAARDRPPGERQRLLDADCGGDPELRREVESLLAAHEKPGAVEALDGWLAPLRERACEEPASDSLPGDLGPYEIVEELGQGGMGIVYLARDPRLERDVAVKVLHPHLAGDPAMTRRFVAEARAASALDHPHVCTVHDLGRLPDGRFYLAMAYCSGGSLARRLRSGPLPPEEALRIAAEVAAGLHATHEAGLVHRDVKPGNVAFSADGVAKVLDFGIAKLADGGATLPGTLLGTPQYMAPEQLRGGRIDRRADVWALGVLLFEMLTGRLPPATDLLTTARDALPGAAPRHGALLPREVSAGARRAIERALTPDPDRRLPTAAAFAALLREAAPVHQERGAPPAPLTSFVGREEELARASALLATARLVTLTGPGGTGKTRLAVEVARRVASEGRAVRFVPLAHLRDPRMVPGALADALGVAAPGIREPLSAVAEAMPAGPLLLVLDNLEQLPAAAPWLAELLSRCPRLRILATSRGPLHVAGEVEIPVPPLAAPPTATRPEEVLATPAGRLFLDRAAGAVPGFTLAPHDASAVAEICRRLDGLPLALELGAARLRLFSPAQLLAQLRERLDLALAGPRDHPARHRTLRQAIAWSYELLSPEHRRLLQALAAFRGGFTVELAGEVVGLELEPLAEGLAALLDQSLLVRVESQGGDPRFTLLETVRAFAVEQMRESGEEPALAAARRRAFLALAERAAPHLAAGSDQRRWMERLQVEQENLRAALESAADSGDATGEKLRLATALWRFWLSRGQIREGLEHLEKLLAGAAGEDPQLRLRALLGAATLAHNVGRNRRADELLTAAHELCREHGEPADLLHVLNNRAWVACELCDVEQAARLGGEALDLARRLGDPRAAAVAHNNLAFLACYQERWDEAAHHCRESLALRRAAGDGRGEAFALITLAWVAHERGSLDEAASLLAEARALLEPLDDHLLLAVTDGHVAALQLARGDAAGALAALADDRWRRCGNVSVYGEVLLQQATAALRLGRLAAAEESLVASGRAWDECGSLWGQARCAAAQAELATARGQHEEARRRWQEALDRARCVGTPSLVERAERALAASSAPPAS